MSNFENAVVAITERLLQNSYHVLPCKVVEYDETLLKVAVKIMVKFKQNYVNEERDFPIIYDVPVAFFTTDNSTCFATSPLQINDMGIVLFSSLDLDNFLSMQDKNESVNSDSYSINQLKDGIFFPVINPWKFMPKNIKTDCYNVVYDKSDFRIYKDGKLQFINATTELVTVESEQMANLITLTSNLIDVVTELKNITTALSTATAAGSPLSCAAQLVAAVSTLTAQLTTLNTTKTNITNTKTAYDTFKKE